MGIDINNELLIMSIFTFGISWFTAYAFMRCFLFAKIFVLIFALKIVEGLGVADSIPFTLLALLGALFGFFGGFSNTIEAFKNFTQTVADIGEGVLNFFTGIYRGLSNFYSVVKDFFEKEQPKKENKKSSQKQQNRKKSYSSNEYDKNNEEKVNQRKEEFRQAREEAKNKKEDSRSNEEILGINSNYTKQELKKIYKTLTARYHPDRYHHMSDEYRKEAEEEFKKVKRAYEILTNKLD